MSIQILVHIRKMVRYLFLFELQRSVFFFKFESIQNFNELAPKVNIYV